MPSQEEEKDPWKYYQRIVPLGRESGGSVAEGVDGGIWAYGIGMDGDLAEIAGSPFATGTTPTSVAVTPDGYCVYATNPGVDNVAGYVLGAAGTLTELPGSPFLIDAAGSYPRYCIVSPDGEHLYVLNYESANITVFAIGGNGILNLIDGSPFDSGAGPSEMVIVGQ